MKILAAIFFTMVAGLSGQVSAETRITKELAASLLSLNGNSQDTKGQADALTARLLTVPEPAHAPARLTLATFARGLATNLAGRELKSTQAEQMAAAITGALRSAGLGTSTFKEHLARFETTLAGTGVNAFSVRILASRLREAGEQVRGPEDLPLAAEQ